MRLTKCNCSLSFFLPHTLEKLVLFEGGGVGRGKLKLDSNIDKIISLEIVEPYLDLFLKSQMDPTSFCYYYIFEISLIHGFCKAHSLISWLELTINWFVKFIAWDEVTWDIQVLGRGITPSPPQKKWGSLFSRHPNYSTNVSISVSLINIRQD